MATSGTMGDTNEQTNYFLIIRQQDLDFCNGNHAAAATMSVLRNCHKAKLEIDAHNKKRNDIAELHGDARWLPEDTCINLSIPEILKRILHLFGRNAVIDALKLLEQSGLITIHPNPNPKYKYDKGRYFQFHPEVFATWLESKRTMLVIEDTENEEEVNEIEATENLDVKKFDSEIAQTQLIDKSDSLKLNYGAFENKPLPREGFENKRPPFKNKPYIKNINNNIKNINQSINMREKVVNLFEKIKLEKNTLPETHSIVEALLEKGMPLKRFYPDALNAIHELTELGATTNTFLKAYDIAFHCKQNDAFGINYLAKVIEDLLTLRNKQPKLSTEKPCLQSPQPKNCEPIYQNDFSKGLDWMGDLLTEEERNEHTRKS